MRACIHTGPRPLAPSEPLAELARGGNTALGGRTAAHAIVHARAQNDPKFNFLKGRCMWLGSRIDCPAPRVLRPRPAHGPWQDRIRHALPPANPSRVSGLSIPVFIPAP
eukprot:scaffold1707_cov357-Prasinococcus_capsulatus_cf.AAC.1